MRLRMIANALGCHWLWVGLTGFLAVALPACSPVTHSDYDGGPTEDLIVPRDFAVPDLIDACKPISGNLVLNPGFETGPDGTVKNTDAGKAAALDPWRGCCGATETSVWSTSTERPRCGARALVLQSQSTASKNVLFQELSISGTGAAPGSPFEYSAYVYLQNADAPSSPALLIDILDLGSGQPTAPTLATSSQVLSQATGGWVRLVASGSLPSRNGPWSVQIRVSNSGTIKAFLDDIALLLK